MERNRYGFQFLKGAIKRAPIHGPETAKHSSFNSLKVRLKVRSPLPGPMDKTGFNSLKVRLKVIFYLSLSYFYSVFQFLKGAIKSRSVYNFPEI